MNHIQGLLDLLIPQLGCTAVVTKSLVVMMFRASCRVPVLFGLLNLQKHHR